jgi:hypothetical protein
MAVGPRRSMSLLVGTWSIRWCWSVHPPGAAGADIPPHRPAKDRPMEMTPPDVPAMLREETRFIPESPHQGIRHPPGAAASVCPPAAMRWSTVMPPKMPSCLRKYCGGSEIGRSLSQHAGGGDQGRPSGQVYVDLGPDMTVMRAAGAGQTTAQGASGARPRAMLHYCHARVPDLSVGPNSTIIRG